MYWRAIDDSPGLSETGNLLIGQRSSHCNTGYRPVVEKQALIDLIKYEIKNKMLGLVRR
jgi:hypothetical protein